MDWPRFSENFRESRTDRWALEGPSFWTIIADADSLFLAHFRRSDIGRGTTPQMGYPEPRLGPRKRTTRIGGGLATIFRKFPEIADQSSGIKGALFLGHNRGCGYPIFRVNPPPTSERLKCATNRLSSAAIRGEKEGPFNSHRSVIDSRGFSGNLGQSAANQGALFLGPNRG